MSQTNLESGRSRQKARTRRALIEAAERLLSAGGTTPTLAEVADEALVSRATAYRYFPSIEALALEVTAYDDLTAPERIFAGLSDAGPAARAARAHDVLFGDAAANETRERILLRSALERGLESGESTSGARRSSRALLVMEAALEPYSRELDDATYDRLVYALAAMTGIEALVTLKDVCRLDTEQAARIMRWAVATLTGAVFSRAGKSDQGSREG